MSDVYDEVDVPDGYIEVFSKRNALTKQPVIGTCTMFVAGTIPVHFQDGHAVVPGEVARMLVARGDITVPGGAAAIEALSYATPPAASAFDGAVAPVQPTVLPEELAGLSTEQLNVLAAIVRNPAKAGEALAALGVIPDDAPPPTPRGESRKPPPGDEAALDAAREHLADDDEEVIAPRIGEPPAPPSFPIPGGFAYLTPEGEARCVAPKGDGSQCNNPARPGTFACGMELHVAKVGELAVSVPAAG